MQSGKYRRMFTVEKILFSVQYTDHEGHQRRALAEALPWDECDGKTHLSGILRASHNTQELGLFTAIVDGDGNANITFQPHIYNLGHVCVDVYAHYPPKPKPAGRPRNAHRKIACKTNFLLSDFSKGKPAGRTKSARQSLVSEVMNIGNQDDLDGHRRQVRRMLKEAGVEIGDSPSLIFSGDEKNSGMLVVTVDIDNKTLDSALRNKPTPFTFKGWICAWGQQEAKYCTLTIDDWSSLGLDPMALENFLNSTDGADTPRLPDKN